MTTPILFVDHAPAIGGAENSLLLLLAHLDRKRWMPHLAGTRGPLLDRAAALGIVTHEVSMPRLRRSISFPVDWTRAARALAGIAGRIGAAVLYANTVRAAFYTAPAARWAGRPFVWHMRDFWLSESKPRYLWIDILLKRLLCATATHVIANSHVVAAHLPAGASLSVVHNGIEIDAFDPMLDGRTFRIEYGIPVEAPLVGTIGRLRPWKGHDRFIRMAARVHTDMPTAYFAIVGGTPFYVDTDYTKRLHRLVREHELTDRFVFTGHLDDVRPALAAFDLFVHAGDPEPFGLVNVEAMAMATPVVAFAHGALPEIVEHDRTGILLPPGVEHAFAQAVVSLLRNSPRRDELGREGRARVEESFSIQRTTAGIEAVLARVTGTLTSIVEKQGR